MAQRSQCLSLICALLLVLSVGNADALKIRGHGSAAIRGHKRLRAAIAARATAPAGLSASQHDKLSSHLSRLETFIQLESLHGAHHDPTMGSVGDHFGCVFRTYWSTVLKACKDSTLGTHLQALHANSPNAHDAVFDTTNFCAELENACDTGGTSTSMALVQLGEVDCSGRSGALAGSEVWCQCNKNGVPIATVQDCYSGGSSMFGGSGRKEKCMWMGTECKAKMPDSGSKYGGASRAAGVMSGAMSGAMSYAGKMGSYAMNAAGKMGSDAMNSAGNAANAAGQMGSDAMNAAGKMGSDAMNAAGNAANAAGQMGSDAINAAGKMGSDAMNAAGKMGSDAMNSAGNAANAAGKMGLSTMNSMGKAGTGAVLAAGAGASAVASSMYSSLFGSSKKKGADPPDPPPAPDDNPEPPLPPIPEVESGGESGGESATFVNPIEEVEEKEAESETSSDTEAAVALPAPDEGCSKHTSCDDCCSHDDRCMYSKGEQICQKRAQDVEAEDSAINDDWCAKSCEPDAEPEPPALPEPPVYPVPWCNYVDIIPKELDWLVIAADDGMAIQTNGRPAVIGTLGKDTIIISYKDGDMENARISYSDAKTQMEQPEVFKVANNVDPKDFSSHYLETAPPALKEDFPTGDKKAEKNKADQLESQLEQFAWDKSKASPECTSNDAKVQSECMTNPECRCEDPLLWIRLVKGDALAAAENPKKPLCLGTSRAGEKKKFGELELVECSDKSLWVARRTIDDGHWGRTSPVGKPNSKLGEPLSANAGMFGKAPYVNNYQLISLGDSRDSNDAGTIFDSMREPARCLDRKAPRRQHSQVRAIMASSEFTCVYNQDPPPSPTGDAIVDAAANKKYQAAMKDSNDEKCARTQQGGMFWDMKKDDAKAACEAFPSTVQELNAWHDSGGAESEEPPTGGCMFVESAPQKDDFACNGDGKKGTCNYCNSAGSVKWDVKKNGLICEDACRNCLSSSNLGKRNTLDHCFSDDSKSKHETIEQMGLFEVVDFALWEKNHPFREDPFESLSADLTNMREAARRGVSRHIMGSTATMWYEKIGESADDNWPEFTLGEGETDDAGADLNDRLKKFIEFFTATRTKFAGYESISSVRRYETSRKEIGNRFTMAGVPPKTHPWCPQVCDDIVINEATAPPLENEFPIETSDYEKILHFSTEDIEDLGEDAEKRKKEELEAIKKEGDNENGEGDEEGNDDAPDEIDESSDEYYQIMIERVILMSQLAAGNEYPQITKLKEDLEAAALPDNEETASLVTEIIEMLKVYTEPESLEAAGKHPTVWAYATCFLADCYSGVGDERALIQAKVRSEDQYKDSTELSVNVRDAIMGGEIKDLGYKTIMKMCELRFNRDPKWWARTPNETPKSFLQLSMRSKEHIEAVLSAPKENVLQSLPSLQRLGSEQLKTACPNNAMVKNGKAELAACENLKQAYFCRENGAIIDMVHKEQCTSENKAFCTFQQSMIMPCLYEDCLDPAEKAAVPVKCMESNTAYGNDKEWVCGYRKVGDSEDDGKCDCGTMRTLQASMAHRLFLGLADWARKNAWLIATVALLVVGTGICLAFPACMSMMGVQSNVPGESLGTMANAGESLGCSGDALDKLWAMNPGISMPAGGPWHVSSITKVSGGGFGGLLGGLKNVGAVATRKYAMIPTPFNMASGLNAHAFEMDKAVNIFGDSKQGMPFKPDYIKPNSVLTVPPECSGFGAGVDYKKAGAKVFGKLLGGVMAANKMFKAVKSFLNWYKNLGIKSYDKEFKADTLFESGVPITLRRDDVDPSTKNKCLGVKTSGSSIFYANFLPCTRPDVIWRSEIKQRDDLETYTKRLYRVQRFSSTSGPQHENYASEFTIALGVADGYGPGRCLRWDANAKGFHAQGCPDSLPVTDTDYVLKSNGMLCVNECKDCLVIDKETNKLALEHCGEPEQKETKAGAALNAIKRLAGGGDYKLKDNIVYFKAQALRGSSTSSTDGKVFDLSPSALAWKVCNWMNDGSGDGQLNRYINDEWPLSKRADICKAVGPNCGFDAAEGMCKPVVLDGTEEGLSANLAQQMNARAEMGQVKMEFGAASDPNNPASSESGTESGSEAVKFRTVNSYSKKILAATAPEQEDGSVANMEDAENEIDADISNIENAIGNDMANNFDDT